MRKGKQNFVKELRDGGAKHTRTERQATRSKGGGEGANQVKKVTVDSTISRQS